ncbi:formin-like protein 6 [Phragmites australis]|uniref:formin-like protein 6 n=1 Tax=Phragmites australis TaxID=29695 RepID=UPI002D79AA87|nr:formin-like protein 6 [Phragmites australis]
MSLFRRLFYRRPPDGLVEISDNILVFDHCFSTDLFEEDELKPYIGGILKQLLGRYSIDSFMVLNFEGGKKDNQVASIFSYYDMSVMGYPRNYEGCPLLTMEMIHHFLRSSESWLSLSQDNFLLIHSEHGGWPVLAFALAALLVYLRRYTDESKALEMVCRQAPDGLAELFSPLDPVPSQLRYLKYVSKRHISPELWPPVDRMLNLNCVIIRKVPNFDGQGGCRPVFRIYGPDPLAPNDRNTKVLFSNPKTSDFVQLYTQEDCEIIKVNVQCPVQGDVVMECTSLDEDYEHEVMMFRAMFSTAFVEDNLLILDRDQIDILWDTKHRFPVDFRVEAIFSDMDMTTTISKSELSSEEKESLLKVADVFSHLDWSSKSDHIRNDESEQKELRSERDGFDVIPLQDTEVSDITAEHGLLDSRSVLTHHIEPADDLSSVPKFEGGEGYFANAHSLPEPETAGLNTHEVQVSKDVNTGEEQKVDNAENKPNSEMRSLNFCDAETGDAAAAEWSDNNSDVFLSDTLSSSSPSSPPKFDEDILEAGMVETRSRPTELQI